MNILPTQQNISYTKCSNNKHIHNVTPQNCISFSGFEHNITYKETYKLLNQIPFLKKFMKIDCEAFEGIQKGLKSFEGLSLKQIQFALSDLHSINLVSGCTNHCLHCYANAQPFIQRSSFEDFSQFCKDVNTLSKKLGRNIVIHHGSPYTDLSFDSDALDMHLIDKNGQKHDYIELAKIMHKKLGFRPIFDTNGWSRNDFDKQKRAEEYVKKLLEDKNYKHFYQINLSLNPFNPKYVRALNIASKYNYPTEKLYQPPQRLRNITDEENLPKELKEAQKLYTEYIYDTVNVLYTFLPLIKANKLGTIIRALNDQMTNMKGYRLSDYSTTIEHILLDLYFKSKTTHTSISDDDLKKVQKLLKVGFDDIFTSGRMEKFYKLKNHSLDGIENFDPLRKQSDMNYKKIKYTKDMFSSSLRYLKIIAPDGRVYLYDNYKVIPTDIQFKTSVSKINKAFSIPVEDFVVTKEMY